MMISAWWLLAALFIGTWIGFFFAALIRAGDDDKKGR